MTGTSGTGTSGRMANHAFHTTTCVLLLIAICLVSSPARGHGAYHDVVAGLQVKLRKAPGDPALRYKLAEAHIGHDEWRACLEELKLIERLAPGRFPTGYLRGLSLHISGNNEAARKELDAFIASNPTHGDALSTRGKVLMKLDLPIEAIADFQKAFDLASSPSTDLILNLADAYEKSGDPDKACQAIDKGLLTAGDSPTLLERALAIETARGNLDGALSRVDALGKVAPDPSPWLAEKARMLTKAGRTKEASTTWSALRDRMLSLPTLERAYPHNREFLRLARTALGESQPPVVNAPPAKSR